MNGEFLPPPGETEKELLSTIERQQAAGNWFFANVRKYTESSSIDLTPVEESGTEVIQAFSRAIKNILELEDVEVRDKALMIIDAQRNEDRRRVDFFNELAGQEVTEYEEFCSVDEAYDLETIESNLDNEMYNLWHANTMKDFGELFEADLNNYLGHVYDTRQAEAKRSTLSTRAGAAIAGTLAICAYIALGAARKN